MVLCAKVALKDAEAAKREILKRGLLDHEHQHGIVHRDV